MLARVVVASLLVALNEGVAAPVMVGILQEDQCADAKDMRARVMFQRTAGGWMAMTSREAMSPADIARQSWTIAFDGRSLGTVKLTDLRPQLIDRADWAYARDKQFAPRGEVPRVAGGAAFSTWCGPATTRPLVLVSQAQAADPAGWKPFPVPLEYRRILHGPLRSSLGATPVVRCRGPEGAQHEVYRFNEKDLKLLKGYRSSTDGVLVSIGLDVAKYGYDGPTDSHWANRWFLIREGQVRLVGVGMELVDGGDYDGDGMSELLFLSAAYNRDGYRLLFNDYRQSIEYIWSYQ